MGDNQFFISSDGKGGFVIVPEFYRAAWDQWADQLGSDDPNLTTPFYATPLPALSNIVFSNPEWRR